MSAGVAQVMVGVVGVVPPLEEPELEPPELEPLELEPLEPEPHAVKAAMATARTRIRPNLVRG